MAHRSWRWLALSLVLTVIGACTTAPPPRPAPISLRPLTAASSSDLAFRALGLVGTPYRSAGSDPSIGFDCSGFVVYVYRDVLGVAAAAHHRRAVRDEAARTAARGVEDRRPGVFDTGGRGISHVGIYVGEGRFVHAPNQGGRVRLDHLDDRYWKERYRGARRVLG